VIPAGTGLKHYRAVEIFKETYGDIERSYKEKEEEAQRALLTQTRIDIQSSGG
jgi:hypothetical protein